MGELSEKNKLVFQRNIRIEKYTTAVKTDKYAVIICAIFN